MLISLSEYDGSVDTPYPTLGTYQPDWSTHLMSVEGYVLADVDSAKVERYVHCPHCGRLSRWNRWE